MSVPITIATDVGLSGCLVEFDADSRDCVVYADVGFVEQPSLVAIDVLGRSVGVHATSVGNPHAVVFGPPADVLFEEFAPVLSNRSVVFPGGANVSFVDSVNVQHDVLSVRVWERGVGPTMACGSAACAVTAVAVQLGVAGVGDDVRVSMPGGVLRVSVSGSGRATLCAGATRVFEGSVFVGA